VQVRFAAATIALAWCFLTVPPAVDGQSQPIIRVGILGPPEEPRFSELAAGLRQGLRDLGYAERTIEILESRVERHDEARVRARVTELVAQRAGVLFVIGSELARRARQVSVQLPIVCLTPGDPVAAGLVSSLARPGGNTTAITFEFPELSGKRLELLKEAVPGLRRALAIYDPRDASPRQGIAAAREAAATLKIALVERPARSRDEILRGLDALPQVDALLVIPGGLPAGHAEEIIRAAHARRVPTMLHARTTSTREAFASYGTSDVNVARQAARLVDKILKGSRAGDLPVERPTKLEFVVNAKTAKALGLTIPSAVLLRVDELIE